LNIVTLLDMAASGNPDRVAVGRLRSTAEDAASLTYPRPAGPGPGRRRGAARARRRRAEAQVRDPDGAVLPDGGIGDVFVRGDQVSGEYRGTASVIVFRDSLPHTPTGKLLRREVLADLLANAEPR